VLICGAVIAVASLKPVAKVAVAGTTAPTATVASTATTTLTPKPKPVVTVPPTTVPPTTVPPTTVPPTTVPPTTAAPIPTSPVTASPVPTSPVPTSPTPPVPTPPVPTPPVPTPPVPTPPVPRRPVPAPPVGFSAAHALAGRIFIPVAGALSCDFLTPVVSQLTIYTWPGNVETASVRFPLQATIDPQESGCDFFFQVVVADSTEYRFVMNEQTEVVSDAVLARLGWNITLIWRGDAPNEGTVPNPPCFGRLR
jgi:hypothetical protein